MPVQGAFHINRMPELCQRKPVIQQVTGMHTAMRARNVDTTPRGGGPFLTVPPAPHFSGASAAYGHVQCRTGMFMLKIQYVQIFFLFILGTVKT